jgi:hypothetical protein
VGRALNAVLSRRSTKADLRSSDNGHVPSSSSARSNTARRSKSVAHLRRRDEQGIMGGWTAAYILGKVASRARFADHEDEWDMPKADGTMSKAEDESDMSREEEGEDTESVERQPRSRWPTEELDFAGT